MIFPIIRIILSVIIGFLIYIIINFCFHRKRDRKLIVSCVFSTIIIYVILCFFPFENLFYSFPTPQAAFEYQTDGGDIIDVIEGNESAVIIYSKENNTSFYVTKKSDSGWKLGSMILGIPVKFGDVNLESSKDFSMILCKAPNTTESILIIDEYTYPTLHSNTVITDSQGTTFEQLPILREGDKLSNTIFHYAVVQSNDPNYEVIINGERVKIEI